MYNSTEMCEVHSAARQGNIDFLMSLLQRGDCPYTQTCGSDNALTISITYGHEQVALSLLRFYERDCVRNFHRPIYVAFTQEEKAQVNMWSRESVTGDQANQIKILMYQNSSKAPHIVHVTVTKREHLVILNEIYKNGLLDVNCKNSAGCSAFHLAAMKGFVTVAAKLLSLGANPNLKTKSGCCPMYYALKYNQIDVVDMLTKYIDLSATNIKGDTLLHAATMSNSVDMFELILEAILRKEAQKHCGALTKDTRYLIKRELLETRNRLGQDVLHKSIVDGNDKVAAHILKLGPRVTEIHAMLKIVIQRRNMELIQELLCRGGSRLFTKNEDIFSALAGDSSGFRVLEELTKHTPCEIFRQHKLGSAEAFLNAIILKNTNIAIRLVELGVSPEITDIGHNTALHLACYWQNVDMVSYLLGLSVNASPRNIKGDTPLHRACEVGNENIIRVLLEFGANVNIPNNNGDYPLYVACKLSNSEIIDDILNLGANPKVINKDGNTLLHCVCKHGHTHLVKKMIDLGVDISIPNGEGHSAAQLALEQGQGELFMELYRFNKNMDLEHRNYFGNTSLMIAAKYADLKCVKFIVGIGGDIHACNTAGDTVLHLSNDVEIDKYLIEMGTDPVRTNKNGDTCYHVAAKRHSFNKLRYYLTLDLDLSIRNNDGQTLLHILLYFEHYILTDLSELLDSKYDQLFTACGLRPDSRGNTILHKASNPRLLKKILQRCPRLDTNACDESGRTVMHNLLYHEVDSLRCLLRFAPDIDPNAVDAAGYTPLHLAACLGRHKHVAALVHSGARVNEKDARGFTPMHYAVVKTCVRCVRHLVTAGGNCHVVNNDGVTPIELCNDTDCREYFKCIGKL